jgi:hypothetical protein
MYHYFDLPPYVKTGFSVWDWKQHPNPIAVLRNPLDRVMSALNFINSSYINDSKNRDLFFANHSAPYMSNTLMGFNFRIIDFYDLEEYIPRRSDRFQSPRTDSRIDNTTKAEDVYVENEFYSLQMLHTELEIYKELMSSYERVSVEEWKELTE